VHTQNHVSCEGCPKTVTAIVLSDVNFILWASNVDDFAAFRANFSYILTAHAQKRLFMSSGKNSDTDVSFLDPYFLRVRYFGDSRTFSVNFVIV